MGLVGCAQYAQKDAMAVREGPLRSDKQLHDNVFKVEKEHFLPSVAVVAPPMVFVERSGTATKKLRIVRLGFGTA
jgi:hypothetical protein